MRKRPSVSKSFTNAQLQAIFARQRAEAKGERETAKLKSALKGFRPKKADRGKIVFIGRNGGRDADKRGRVGYAVYIDTKGRKKPVRSYDRKSKKLEKIPTPKKIQSIDVSRVRSKRAKKQFIEVKLNKVASGFLNKIPANRKLKKSEKIKLPESGTRYNGGGKFNRIDRGSEGCKKIAKELTLAINRQRGKKDFLVTIGISIKSASGERLWITTQRRVARRDSQTATEAEMREFIGREVYAFLARELVDRGLVTKGSAQFIRRLPENKKKKSGFTKEGFLWAGNGAELCEIESVQWRFDQITF